MVGEATKKPWHKSELLGHTDEDSDTHIDFVAVKASCVQRCSVDRSMDTWGTDSVRLVNHLQHLHRHTRSASSKHPMCFGLAPSARVGK